jgi:hypothetical protein
MAREEPGLDAPIPNEELPNELVPWEPLNNLPAVLYCEAVHDDYEGFRVLLKGAGPTDDMMRIIFEGVVAYRNINESYRLKSLPLNESRTLFRVKNSTWTPWLCEESGGVLLAEKLTHFAIFTPEDFLDVVTQCDPIAEWLNE